MWIAWLFMRTEGKCTDGTLKAGLAGTFVFNILVELKHKAKCSKPKTTKTLEIP